MKTVNNTSAEQAKQQVSDIQFFGNGDTFKLICKASSKSENWMKSTKAMQIDNVGVVLQISTQQGDNVAEALQYISNVKIHTDEQGIKSIIQI